jgi:oligopeptidase B
MYWEPAKYVAKMRALAAGAPATLFNINLDASHSGASARYDYLREIVFDCAWVLGVWVANGKQLRPSMILGAS